MPVSVQEFASKIKQKYPQYANIDDNTLTQKMIQKYPQYKNQVNFGTPTQASQPKPQPQPAPTDFWGKVKEGAMQGFMKAGEVLSPLTRNLQNDQSDFSKGVRNFQNSAITKTLDTLGNQASYALDSYENTVNPTAFASKMAGKKDFQSAPLSYLAGKSQEALQGFTGDVKKRSMQESGADENSLSTIAGDLTGTIAGSLPTMYAGGQATNLIKNSSLLNKFLPQANALKNIISNVGGGLVSTEGNVIGQKRRLADLSELGTGAAIDAVLSGGGELTNKLGNLLFSKTVPTTITQAGKDSLRNLDLGEALSSTGVSWNRNQLKSKIKDKIKSFSGILDDEILKLDNQSGLVVKNQKGSIDSQKLIENLREKVLQNPKLKAQFGDTKAMNKAISNVIDEYQTVVGRKKTLTYAEVQNLKKKLGQGLGSFFDKADNAGKAKNIANETIRKNAQTIIEDAIPQAKNINQKMSPLITALNRLEKKGPLKGLLYDLIAGGNFAAYQGVTGNAQKPEDYVSNLLKGMLVRRLGTSTFAKTTGGTALKNFSKSTPTLSQLLKTLIPKN